MGGSRPDAVGAVLFDAGGTLLHLWRPPAERFAYLCGLAGVALPPERRRDAARACALHLRDHPERDATTPAYWQAHNRAGLAAAGRAGDLDAAAERVSTLAAGLPPAWVVDADAPHVLEALRAVGLRLGVVSNWNGSLRRCLRGLGLAPFFDVIVDSAVVGVAKPDPAIFFLACKALGVEPGRCLHVGDRIDTDVRGALAAGATPVLFDPLDLDGTDGLRVTRLADVVDVVASGRALG